MTFREARMIGATKQNADTIEKIRDRLGVGKRFVLLGTKTRKWTGKYDDLVYYEYDERFIGTLAKPPTYGGSVFGSYIAEWLSKSQGMPLIINDKKREYDLHRFPNNISFSNMKELGFVPEGLTQMKTLAPKFINYEAQYQIGINLPQIYKFQTMVGMSVFQHLFKLDKDDSSSAYQDAGMNLWLEKPGDIETAIEMNDLYEQVLIEKGNRSNVSGAFSRDIKTMSKSCIFDGVTFDWERELTRTDVIPTIVFKTGIFDLKSNEERYLQTYDAFIAALIYELRDKQKIKPCIEVYEEFDIGLEGVISEIYTRKIDKEGDKSNSMLFITQEISHVPDAILGFSDVILCGRLMLKQWRKKIIDRGYSDDADEAIQNLDSFGFPKQWLAFFKDGSYVRFYPLDPFSAYKIRVKQR